MRTVICRKFGNERFGRALYRNCGRRAPSVWMGAVDGPYAEPTRFGTDSASAGSSRSCSLWLRARRWCFVNRHGIRGAVRPSDGRRGWNTKRAR